MGGFLNNTVWSPPQPVVLLGSLGSVLTVTAGGLAFLAAGAGGGIGNARASNNLAPGATNNLNPGGAWPTGFGRLILTATGGAANVTGLVAGVDNQWLFIFNNDATNTITLNSQNTGSSAPNRFAYVADLALAPGSSVIAVYDSTLGRWLL